MATGVSIFYEFANSETTETGSLDSAALCLVKDSIYVLEDGNWRRAFSFDWFEYLWLDSQGREIGNLEIQRYGAGWTGSPSRIGLLDDEGNRQDEKGLEFDLGIGILSGRRGTKGNAIQLCEIHHEINGTLYPVLAELVNGLWQPMRDLWDSPSASSAIYISADEGVQLPPPPAGDGSIDIPAATGPRSRPSALAERLIT
jgi:hypothetical protein